MDIRPTISRVSGQTTDISETFKSPIIIKRTADTTVTVKDGETVVIGNLDALFMEVGSDFPHHFWLHLQPGAPGEAVRKRIVEKGYLTNIWRSAPDILAEEQAQLERVGLFGTAHPTERARQAVVDAWDVRNDVRLV